MPQREHIDVEAWPLDASTGAWQFGQQRIVILYSLNDLGARQAHYKEL